MVKMLSPTAWFIHQTAPRHLGVGLTRTRGADLVPWGAETVRASERTPVLGTADGEAVIDSEIYRILEFKGTRKSPQIHS